MTPAFIKTERKTEELHPNPINPRTLKEKAFKELQKSLKDDPHFFQARPLIVSMAEGRENTIIAGNQRLEAAKALGWATVPVIEVRGATLEEEKQWMVKDNLHKGEWDFEKLDDGFDLAFLKEMGFDEKGLNKVLGSMDNSQDDEFDAEKEAEAIKEPVVQRGEIWQLGEHRLMCGDSTKREEVEVLMNGKKADMVFTDPPYALFGNSTGVTGITDDKMVRPFFLAIFQRIYEFVRVFSHVYVCCDWHSAFSLQEQAKDAGLRAKNMCIWDKGDGGVGGMYQNCHEIVWFFSKPIQDKTLGQGKSGERTVNGKPNIWRFKRESRERVHGAQKPLEMVEAAVTNSSDGGQVVLDLFLGSGTTLIACENTKRICYGMEIDPKYCDVIIKRWEEKTSKKAVKVSV